MSRSSRAAIIPLHPSAPLSRHERPETSVDGATLARDLQGLAGEVRFDAGSRALYSTDASNYRQVPLGVVLPRSADDVIRALEAIRRHGGDLVARGGGTSLAGQTCNTGVVFDFSKYMNRVLALDPEGRTARVEPGLVLDDLRAAARPHGLTFGPDPATHQYCTLGGMIGNNSCGVHSVLAANYGPGPTTAHSVESLDVLTYGGLRLRVGETPDREYERILAGGGRAAALYRQLRDFQGRYADLIRREFPDIPRRVSGYNLPALLPENGFHVARALVGSECTLALVLEATLTLIPALPCRALVVIGFDDVFAAADRVPEVLRHKPVGLEGFDQGLVDDLREIGLDGEQLKLLPPGRSWLLVEFGGETQEEATGRAREFASGMSRELKDAAVCRFDDPEAQETLWNIRESGLAATARVSSRNPTWPGWEDSAVPPERLGNYLRDLDALIREHGYEADLYGHFGQGCVHCRIDFELRTAAGIAQFRRFMERAADLVHRHGGSLSGEHGDGQARAELLPRMFSPEMMQAFREFKSIWDPGWHMNPGKVVDPNRLDADLRLGTDYDPPPQKTWFAFPEDRGSFAHATLRCVGVGKCRKTESGTMCPSYMVTREEKHTTRGRAQLLFEMLEGDPLAHGFQAEHVHEALDLCLACKGCKGECPVSVDMATYKAEFLAHYYEKRWRPRTAHAFGRIRTWARLTSALGLPRLVNTAAAAPGLGALMKAAAGMPQERAIPAFAPQTFRELFRARPPRPGGDRPRVLLWPDTFNDHFHPETLQAGADVLEAMGFTVDLPAPHLCCGRPLYDYGLLSVARQRLASVMAVLHDDIRTGVPVVGLEPSCVSVFRDELPNLFPALESAHRLSTQTFTFAEFVDAHAERLPAASLDRRALVHGHCHHKAVMQMHPDRAVLDRLGLQYELLDSGCCGMAGAFGFEREHYGVSMAVGERVLLPAVRGAAPDTLIVADGFSCREQIAQSTDRRALHLAEVLRLSIDGDGRLEAGGPPERAWVQDHREARLTARHAWGGALVAAGLLLAALVRPRSTRARRRAPS